MEWARFKLLKSHVLCEYGTDHFNFSKFTEFDINMKLNRVNDPGVLILSPFAGAGGTMHEALCVNPYEIGNVASMVHRALTMPIEEREVRMTALRYLEFLGKIISKTHI